MPPKRKSALEELIKRGFVADGELLRYKSKHGQLMAVGRAREGGIEVAGASKLLGYTAFEEVAGSKYHRPAEHTHTTSSRSLQSLSLLAAASDGGARQRAAEPAEPAVELLEDDNDDLCHICGLGGDLMCCETCPGVFHASCLGLAAPPEGDYYCPLCRCAMCGIGGSEGFMPTGCVWLDCKGFKGPELLRQYGHPHIAAEPAARPAAASAAGVKSEPLPAISAVLNSREEGEAASGAGTGNAEGSQSMQVDGQAAAAAAVEGLADFSQLESAACRPAEAAPAPLEAAGSTAAAATASDAAAVYCPVTCQWMHLRCCPPDLAQQLRKGDPQLLISSESAVTASTRLAAACSAGLIHLGSIVEGTKARPAGQGEATGSRSGSALHPLPLSLLVVRGAAAACPHDCRGCTPCYTSEQRQELQVALSTALHVLHSCYEPLPDSRTGADMLPLLLRGAVLAGGEADYSGMHTALLYAGQAVVAVAVFRCFGELAEVPVLAVRPELQRHNGLGRLLLASVERLLLLAGTKAVHTPAFTADGAPYLAVPPPGAPAAGEPADAAGQPAQQQQQQQPELAPPLQARWGYSLAPAAAMQEVVKHPLVRMPGVLLAFKELSAGTVLPPPRLPQRLRWNGGSGLDARQLLKEGWLAAVTPSALSGAAGRPPLPPAVGRNSVRTSRPEAAGKREPSISPSAAGKAAAQARSAAAQAVGLRQRQQQQAATPSVAAAGGTPAQQQAQQQLQMLTFMQQQQMLAQHAQQDPAQQAQQAQSYAAYQHMMLQHQQQMQLLQQQQPELYAQLLAQYAAQHQQLLAAQQQQQVLLAAQHLPVQQQQQQQGISLTNKMLQHMQQQQQ